MRNLSMTTRPTTLALFNYDWDQIALSRLATTWPHHHAGFDLFSFPSNARLAWFDMDRFVALWAWRARRLGLRAVVSNHEQFGALAAALLAQMGAQTADATVRLLWTNHFGAQCQYCPSCCWTGET